MPVRLVIIALLFVLSGITSAVAMGQAMSQHLLLFDVGIINLFIGVGLFTISNRMRIWALFASLLYIVWCPIFIVLTLSSQQPAMFRILSIPYAEIPPGVTVAFTILVFLYSCWQFQVLRQPEIRDLFSHA